MINSERFLPGLLVSAQGALIITLMTMIVSFVSGCQKNPNSRKAPVTIDLQKILQEETDVPVSRYADEIEYIPLEITPESAITYIRTIYLIEDLILLRSGNDLLVFDRNSGRFIRKIGKQGRGPGEYQSPVECFYNEYDSMIYTRAERSVNRYNLVTYNLNGSYIGSTPNIIISDPSLEKGDAEPILKAFSGRDTTVYYINNSTGKMSRRLFITAGGEILNSFPQYEKWLPEEVSISQSPIFFKHDNKISFKEKSNDTVFSVTAGKLVPRLILSTGDLRCPYKLSRQEAIAQLTKPEDYLHVVNIFETTASIFFDIGSKNTGDGSDPGTFKLIRNLCIYDKATGKTAVCRGNYESSNSCLTDDINGFMPLFPISATSGNELIAFLQAADIEKWKSENPQLLTRLQTKLLWLSKISEYDNPVIVVMKHKD